MGKLLVYGRYFGLPDTLIRSRIPGLIAFAELGTRAGSRIQALSGGMKRRLTLARSLINDPDLIFMDEPTTGLDPSPTSHLGAAAPIANQGKTIFLTTHFMDEAERLCHRIAIMDHGRIIAAGAPRELIERHIEPQVVEIYGDGAEGWVTAFGQAHSRRCEKAGETMFCCIRTMLLRWCTTSRSGAGCCHLHRHANLEDVFLKLTGRELRD